MSGQVFALEPKEILLGIFVGRRVVVCQAVHVFLYA